MDVAARIPGCDEVLQLAWGKRGERSFVRREAVDAQAACRVAMQGGGGEVSEKAGGRGRGGGNRGGRRGGDGRGAPSAGDRSMRVTRVTERVRSLPPPFGLDTVQMLRAASAAMSLSPHKAMQVAEQLYMSGLISVSSQAILPCISIIWHLIDPV